MKRLVTLFVSLALIISSCDSNDDQASLAPIDVFRQSMVGDWQSQSSEFDEEAQNFGYRTLSIQGDTWGIVVERFADMERTIPLFTLEFEGPYEITEESSVIPGSYNGTFSFSEKYFTTFIDPALLGLSDCDLEIGVRKDVSDMDCGWLESVTHCPADYDLITVEGTVLTPGKRTEDMCSPEGRPTEKGFPMNKA